MAEKFLLHAFITGLVRTAFQCQNERRKHFEACAWPAGQFGPLTAAAYAVKQDETEKKRAIVCGSTDGDAQEGP